MNSPDLARAEALVARHPPARVQAGGRTIAYREEGTGRALVLLHGIGNQSGAWTQQLDVLQSRFRVIAWDAPGYGGSDPIEAAWPRAADYAAALEALLDRLDIKRAILVGSSLGALMAGSYAADHPERVAGLVLLNPAGGYGDATAEQRDARLHARLARLTKLGPEGMAKELPAGMLSADAPADARSLACWSQSKIRTEGYVQAARMLAHGQIAADAVRYTGPVLVVAGSADTITPAASCERIARAFPRGAFRLLDGPGHLSYLETPATINELIVEFAATCALETAA